MPIYLPETAEETIQLLRKYVDFLYCIYYVGTVRVSGYHYYCSISSSIPNENGN